MKYLLIIILTLSCFATNIDKQIEAIRNAPVEKRFELMNAFKKEIIKMHEEERIKAIGKLKSVTKSKYGNRALKEIKSKQAQIDKKQRYGQKHKRKHKSSVTEKYLESHIENQIEEHIGTQVEEEIENEIENQIEDEQDDDD